MKYLEIVDFQNQTLLYTYFAFFTLQSQILRDSFSKMKEKSHEKLLYDFQASHVFLLFYFFLFLLYDLIITWNIVMRGHFFFLRLRQFAARNLIFALKSSSETRHVSGRIINALCILACRTRALILSGRMPVVMRSVAGSSTGTGLADGRLPGVLVEQGWEKKSGTRSQNLNWILLRPRVPLIANDRKSLVRSE